MKGNQRKYGFTLAEIIIATMVTVIAVSMCMVGFVYIIKSYDQMDVQQELDTEIQNSMERLKYDLRLSTLNNKYMFFYPQGTQTHTAISFPLAGTNGSGGVLCDTNGNIIWTQQIVYHVKTSTPNELLKTTFNPQLTNMTADQYQQQLNYCVTNGNGYGTIGGAHATTDVLFTDLLQWNISEQAGIFDGYASALSRQDSTLGSIVLSNGWHTFQFTVTGKNTNSTGYNVGIDTLNVSPSHCDREAETQSVIATSGGVSPSWGDRSGQGSWGNNAELSFPATATNQSFTLSMYNDVWEDTTFGGAGELYNDGVNTGSKTTQLYYDTNMSPKDFVIKLAGGPSTSNSYAWYAYQQTQDSAAGESSSSDQSGRAMRVLIRGGDVTNGGWLLKQGSKCRVCFMAGTNALHITGACVARCAGASGCTPDAAAGTRVNMTFAGSASATIGALSNMWSDYASLPITTSNSFLVTYMVSPSNSPNSAWKWTESAWADDVPGCYMMTNNAAANWTNDTWSTFELPDTNGVIWVVATNYLRGVQYLDVSYMSNGYYQSQIFDTQCTNPIYHQMTWVGTTPPGTSLGMEIRTGFQPDLSDALAWTSSGFMTTPPWPMGPGGRYAQFRAQLQSTSCLTSPELQSVTVDWPGLTDSVDIGGTFTKGTNYGIFQVLVDGQTLKRGIILSLNIFKWARSVGGGSNLMSSGLTSEIQPWNTGR